VGGLFALRIVNRDELRTLRGRDEAEPETGLPGES